LRIFLAAFSLLLLAGCAGTLPDLTQAHGPCTNRTGGWCDFTRELAADSFVYAQLSNNAYCDDNKTLALPPGYREVRRYPDTEVCELERRVASGEKALKQQLKDLHKARKAAREGAPSDNGFAWAVYDHVDPASGRLIERIIAYRGTDLGDIGDWLHGNLGKAQLTMGQGLYEREKADLAAGGHAAVPIRATGHSLGGAIALQVSVDNAGVDAFVFNPSPNYNFEPGLEGNRRVAIVERGDILEMLRKRKMPARQELLFINCQPNASGFAAHSVLKLAKCLTWIASRTSTTARASLRANAIIDPPTGEIANQLWGLTPDTKLDLPEETTE